jgi:hypothetical protein
VIVHSGAADSSPDLTGRRQNGPAGGVFAIHHAEFHEPGDDHFSAAEGVTLIVAKQGTDVWNGLSNLVAIGTTGPETQCHPKSRPRVLLLRVA